MTETNKTVHSWYIPRSIPTGDAPEEIAVDWVNIPLPLRYTDPERIREYGKRLRQYTLEGAERPEEPASVAGVNRSILFDLVKFDDSAIVELDDAVKALRIFDKDAAAEWWSKRYFKGNLAFIMEPGDQILSSIEMVEAMPGIETFDKVRIESRLSDRVSVLNIPGLDLSVVTFEIDLSA